MSSEQTRIVDEPFFKEGVKQVARKFIFEKYKINTDRGVGDGVNYLGEICRFNIEGTVNGETRKLHIIGKVVGNNESKRKVLQLNDTAVMECHIYNELFPALDSMQERFGVVKKFSHPAAYLATSKDHEELILLEDLSKSSPPFSLPKNGKNLDYDHAKLILEKLGHFHALSFSLKRYNPDVFEELAKIAADDEVELKIHTMLPKIVSDAYAAGTAHFPEAKSILDDFMEDVCGKSEKLFDEPDEHSVLCHCDVWSYNLLYSYKDDAPYEVMLIDWQTVKHISPVIDLLICLFVCVEEKARQIHLHDFLSLYYGSLRNHLVEVNCDPNATFSEDVFRSHLKKYIPPVLVHCLTLLPVFAEDKFNVDSFLNTDDDEPNLSIINYSDMFNSRFKQMAKDIGQLLHM